jgi:hypothetical protein
MAVAPSERAPVERAQLLSVAEEERLVHGYLIDQPTQELRPASADPQRV